MGEAGALLYVFALVELDNFDLGSTEGTWLLMSGRKDPIPSRKGYCGLFEKARAKMFHGAV